MFASSHPFSYESVSANPKQEPPSTDLDGIHYEILHNNSFLRLHTPEGRTYHQMQAHYYYQLPDWKLHFAIDPEDLARAWNIIANLFLEKRCRTTMKMAIPDYGVDRWPAHMHGREITVYIYQHKKYYEALNWSNGPGVEMQHSREYWMSFAMEAESRLRQNNIKPRPHPQGEKVLGVYVSLRNEAFIQLKPQWESTVGTNLRVDFNSHIYCYPPNEAGYNAAGHKNPFEIKLYAFLSQSPFKKLKRNEVKEALSQRKQKLAITATDKNNFVTVQIIQADCDTKKLIKELYEKFLKNDPLFHFFFEPALIIRISSIDIREKILDHLTKNQISFRIYDYPTPQPHAEYYRYGESTGGPVMENLEIYLPLFHLNAVAALTLADDRYLIYTERSTHTMFNMAGFSRHEEAQKLVELAELKAEKPLELSKPNEYKGP